MKEKYLEILDKIKAREDFRTWMKEPFNSGDKTIATNGYTLVSIPKIEGFEEVLNKIKTVYPLDYNCEKQISVSEIKEAVKIFPTVDCFDEILTTCDACYGSGVVDFEFYYKHESFNQECECPICEGDGKTTVESKIPNGKKDFDFTYFFQIGVCVFNLKRIFELLFIIDKLEVEAITLVFQIDPNKPSLFKINDVELLIMSTASIEGNIYKVINI